MPQEPRSRTKLKLLGEDCGEEQPWPPATPTHRIGEGLENWRGFEADSSSIVTVAVMSNLRLPLPVASSFYLRRGT